MRDIPKWTTYYLNIADTVASRASCFRAKVGCIIVRDKQIISTGYNGAPRGRVDCLVKGECYREIADIKSGTELDKCYASGAHAELNALINAARHGVSVNGAEMFLVGHDFCCESCQAAILNANIKRVTIRTRDGLVTRLVPTEDFASHGLDNYDERLDWPRGLY